MRYAHHDQKLQHVQNVADACLLADSCMVMALGPDED